MRVSEAMDAAGINIDGEPINENLIEATCSACSRKQRLDEVKVQEGQGTTRYLCGGCGRPFVIVGPYKHKSLTKLRDEGVAVYRLNANAIASLGGMELHVPGSKHQWPPED